MIGVRFAEGLEFFRRAAVLEAASGVHVGQDDDLFGAENLRRVGHEFDAAEGDHVGVGFRRLARQLEAVADEIGEVLNVGGLVVMRQDNRVLLLAEAIDLGEQILSGRQVGLCGHCVSRLVLLGPL